MDHIFPSYAHAEQGQLSRRDIREPDAECYPVAGSHAARVTIDRLAGDAVVAMDNFGADLTFFPENGCGHHGNSTL